MTKERIRMALRISCVSLILFLVTGGIVALAEFLRPDKGSFFFLFAVFSAYLAQIFLAISSFAFMFFYVAPIAFQFLYGMIEGDDKTRRKLTVFAPMRFLLNVKKDER